MQTSALPPAPSLVDEGLIGLREAAKLFPPRGCERTAPSTIWRWITRGFKGVKLEAARTPSGWLTTRPAVQRFLDRLTTLQLGCDEEKRETREAARRSGRPSEATLALHAMGIGNGKATRKTEAKSRAL